MLRSCVRRWIWAAIVVVIAIAGLVMIGDVRGLGDRLDDFQWSAFVVAMGLALGNYAIRFARWQIYLRQQQVAVPFGSSALVFGAGLSLAITPGKLRGNVTRRSCCNGDAYRSAAASWSRTSIRPIAARIGSIANGIQT